ncbi:MAG: hypothetical protein HY687_05985 [Chloroflexi bacterium]|nr:hypothetical protein [Chloroflexota bacterium]
MGMERKPPGYVDTYRGIKKLWPLLVGALVVVGLVVGYRMTQKGNQKTEKQ